jgi:hypothetical protein
MSRRRIVLLSAIAALLVAAPTAAAATLSGSTGQTTVFQLWFARSGHLWVSKRTVPTTITPVRTALDTLLLGPTAAERSGGVSTTIPAGTRVRSLSVAGGVATLDVTATFGGAGRMKLGQLAQTLGQFSIVRTVKLLESGKPLARFAVGDYDDLLPPITAGAPGIGSTQLGVVAVTGNAKVYEGALQVSVLSQAGVLLARTYVVASCGTGCRGFYSAHLKFSVSQQQLGTVVVSSTAGGGVGAATVRVPVVLAPA